MTIKALGYVIIDTPQPAAWERFLLDVVGTMAGEGAARGAYYRVDDRFFRFWVRPAEDEQLAAAAYEVADAADLSRVRATLSELGAAFDDGSSADAADRNVAEFVSAVDPSGNKLEFFYGEQARQMAPFESAAGVSSFVTGDMGLGHAVFAAPPPHFGDTHEFYRALGFRDTDLPHFKFSDDPADPGMRFAFMHASNGRHHSLAIGEMPGPPAGCIHLMLEMATMNDVGKCHDRMRAARITESATIGRHLNDQTFGFYMQTPGGYDLEIGCDPLVIDPANWETTAHLQPSEWGHVWAWQRAQEGENA